MPGGTEASPKSDEIMLLADVSTAGATIANAAIVELVHLSTLADDAAECCEHVL